MPAFSATVFTRYILASSTALKSTSNANNGISISPITIPSTNSTTPVPTSDQKSPELLYFRDSRYPLSAFISSISWVLS